MGKLASVVAPEGFARLGRYELGREIGSGGMGRVVEATNTALGKRVAIKRFHPGLALKRESLARFVGEGRAIARLHHPHIVEIFDLEEPEDGTPYLVMELLEGCTLAQRLARSSRLSVPEAIDVVLPLASALAAAHDAGIVHRDVKPSNIFLRGGRTADPCLVDFGISRDAGGSTGEEITHSGTILGSYPYFSPEHTRGAKHVTAQSDLYSLAAVLYECVTGSRPFEGETAYELMHAIATKDARPPSLVVPSLPRELDEIVARAMDRDLLRRYPTMRAFGAALLDLASPRTWHVWSKDFIASEGGPASLERTVEEDSPETPLVAASAPRERPRRIERAVVGAGAALALGAAVLLSLAVLRERHEAALSSGAGARQSSAPAAAPQGRTEEPAPAPPSVALPIVPSASSPPPAKAIPRPAVTGPGRRPAPSGSAPEERGSNGVPILE